MKRNMTILTVAAVFSLGLAGCENSNIFSWTHSEGSDKSTEALLADGMKALSDEDFAKAIEYFQDILEKDPDNSEALYGLASAELKHSGLDLEDLIPKFLEQGNSSSSAPSAFRGSSTMSAEADLITLDFAKLSAGTASAVEALRKIADGRGDGNIPADDFDVNLNLGIALTINAAAELLDWAESTGSVEIKENYDVIVDTSQVDSAVLKSKLNIAFDKVDDAIDYIRVAARVVGGTDAINDVEEAFEELKSQIKTEIDKL